MARSPPRLRAAQHNGHGVDVTRCLLMTQSRHQWRPSRAHESPMRTQQRSRCGRYRRE